VRSLTAKQVIRVLEQNGFVLSRRHGSHMIFKHAQKGIIVPVPLHGGTKPIPRGTFLAIVKQSKNPKDGFSPK
jgi:predicted RNA binding protein YcfA (HicA-like mRNA interferase family)